jgi:pimeloyl-ACP methyl ester carboxylesterase
VQISKLEFGRITIGRVELSYVAQGGGEPVLFVHGSNSDYRIWDAHREAVASKYRFIALTQRYFGKEPWPDQGEKFSIQTLADDLSAFIADLDLAPVTIVGWSLGGGVCLTMAAQHPERVKRMFLYEPALASFLERPEDVETAAGDRTSMAGVARPLAEKGDLTGAVRAFMEGVNGEAGAFDRLGPEVQELMIDNARMLPLLFAGPPAPNVSAGELRSLVVPVTVALGSKSRSFYRIAATKAQRLLSRAEFQIIEGANHLWPVEDPDAFTARVMNFLDRL